MAEKNMISVIVPTLNEENFLEPLLKSIKSQDLFDYEIIIADAGSKDSTLEIANRYNCRITGGGLPAKGRNEGAKVALGDLLLFMDADCVLPKGFLKNSQEELSRRSLDIASFCLLPLSRKAIPTMLLNIFYNYPILILEKILPHGATGILVKKDYFDKLGGFDEEVTLAEDHYMVRQVIKKFRAKFGIIRSVKLITSDRRFRTDGWILTYFKFILCELHLIFLGPVKSDIFKYRFNHYKKSSQSGSKKIN